MSEAVGAFRSLVHRVRVDMLWLINRLTCLAKPGAVVVVVVVVLWLFRGRAVGTVGCMEDKACCLEVRMWSRSEAS